MLVGVGQNMLITVDFADTVCVSSRGAAASVFIMAERIFVFVDRSVVRLAKSVKS